MDKKPCNNSPEAEIRKGPWTMEEDLILINYIANHGEGVWNSLARSAGLKRTGKSCRLRWLNYLRPDVRRGNITPEEQLLIIELHAKWGNRWSKIAKHLPGRTDNEIKNYWRTRIQKHIKPPETSLLTGQSSEQQQQHTNNNNNDGHDNHQHHHHYHHHHEEATSSSKISHAGADSVDTYSPPSYTTSMETFSVNPFPSNESTDNMWNVEDLWTMQLLNGD